MPLNRQSYRHLASITEPQTATAEMRSADFGVSQGCKKCLLWSALNDNPHKSLNLRHETKASANGLV